MVMDGSDDSGGKVDIGIGGMSKFHSLLFLLLVLATMNNRAVRSLSSIEGTLCRARCVSRFGC